MNNPIYRMTTEYVGIFIKVEHEGVDNRHYFLVDDLGGEQYIGTFPPSKNQIAEYRNQLLRTK